MFTIAICYAGHISLYLSINVGIKSLVWRKDYSKGINIPKEVNEKHICPRDFWGRASVIMYIKSEHLIMKFNTSWPVVFSFYN